MLNNEHTNLIQIYTRYSKYKMTSITDNKRTLYGWYSKLADMNVKILGRDDYSPYVYYNTPTGATVKVTCVNYSYTESGTAWPDIECIGEVTTYAGKNDYSLPKTIDNQS
jgi:hypothetical protein